VIERYLQKQVERDLRNKMVFVAGPRQVGKTTLAKKLLSGEEGYLNWDVPEDRDAILRRELPPVDFYAFDEIHKYRSWRGYLKGLYDQRQGRCRILVTGSARLDYYHFGGDSLQGRYHLLRLHPLSAAELSIGTSPPLMDLLRYGGFPEPFFAASETETRRWSREYRSRLISEEVRDLESVSDLGNLELLAIRLPDLVGSPLSVNALREDLHVSHKTVSAWLAIFERLYSIVRLSPFGAPTIRAVKKEQKHYHWDWTVVRDLPNRFENLVAMHLLKWVHFRQDTEGLDLELRYFRDVDGRETDFVVTEANAPVLLVEAKWGDDEIARGLRYLVRRFPDAKACQISATGTKDFLSPEGIRVRPAAGFLQELV